MTEYTIEPRVKKRWFKENELYYDLVKHSTKGKYLYSGIDSDWVIFQQKQTVFTSKNIEEVVTIKNNLDEYNI